MSEFTLGLEEEYQLVEPEDGSLVSAARAVLRDDWTGELRHELQESTIEIGTQVCVDGGALRAEVRRLRFQAATVAAAQDLVIAAAGVHPFSRWEHHATSDHERYLRITRNYGRIARDEHNFGMHVHVKVPAACDRTVLMTRLRLYLPHLLALSCSSPYFERADTGYASFRTILWRRWPTNGPPPRLADDSEYREFVRVLTAAGCIDDARDLYWMLRPHPIYPTLEFRVCDVCPSLDDALAIATLTRVLVAAAAHDDLPHHAQSLPDAAADAVLADDIWRAARDGLDARLVRPGTPGGARPLRVEIETLLAHLRPLAADLGEHDLGSTVGRLLERGNAADRMREVNLDLQDLHALARWLAAETVLGTGADRRTRQRIGSFS